MSNKIFTELEMRQLEKNPHVRHVSEKAITYEPSFKLAAVLSYMEGNTPQQIFEQAQFHLETIGREQPQRCLKRWRATYNTYGEAGLLEERRGKGSSGRPAGTLSTEEQLKRAEARIKLLEAENDLLKKLEALERQKRKP